MNIALVHRDLHQVTRGGVCTMYRALAEQLLDRGHRVTLVTQETQSPVRLQGAAAATLPRTDDLAAHCRRVRAALEDLRPDVAECSSWEFELLDYARAHRRGRAAVMVRGDLTARTMGSTELVRGEAELIALADGVVAVSRYARDDLARAYGVDATIIPNGVDRRRFDPGLSWRPPASGFRLILDGGGKAIERVPLQEFLADDLGSWAGFFRRPEPPDADASGPVRLVWVGKMTEMKGWDRLQRLVVSLRGLARFLIVLGHGQVHYPLTIASEPHVLFAQDLDDQDMALAYRWASFLLSTSRWEGFGLAMAEALACGVPVLVPGELRAARELVVEGENGLTYASEDGLLRLIAARPRLRGGLSDRFDWSVNAERTLAAYAQLLGTQVRTAVN